MKQPNIIFIMADDLGAWALGAYGNPEIQTPNIDSLAAGGTLFSNFFSTSPVCSASTASVFTGKIPSAHGVHDWIRSGNVDISAQSEEIKADKAFIMERQPIEYLKGQIAYTDILAKNGYVCALSGNWGLGDTANTRHSFSHWHTLARGECDYFRPDIMKERRVTYAEQYVTDMITDDAIGFIDRRRKYEAPFYLSVHYTAPHSPWDERSHKNELLTLYKDCTFDYVPDLPIHPHQASTCPSGIGSTRKALLRGYYAAITALDQNIGRIINKLELMGILNDTVIIFTSDNGMNMGHHGIWGKGNGTFPLNMYDTSLHVPFIVRCPNTPLGVTCNALISQYDIMPTILDLADLSSHKNDNLPGESFANQLYGNQGNRRDHAIVFGEYGPMRMVRTNKYKYIHRFPYGPNEFYDLIHDPDEDKNLVEESHYRMIMNTMRKVMNIWFAKYADPSVDGCREGVTGYGQLDLAGIHASAKRTYYSRHL